MCRITQVLCGSLVVFLLSSYTTAMAPSWLSAVSFQCDGEDDVCAGALIGEQWVLTTASCFQKCKEEQPKRFKAFLNIPDRAGNSRRGALKSGSKVSVDHIWIHPSYDSSTFANNLALVKLGCHDLSLDIDVDLNTTTCSVPMDCSVQSHSGYLHTTSFDRLRSRKQNWQIDSEGNVILSRCSVALGMDTIYYCANQPVAVSSDKIGECFRRQRTIPATPICHHNEWITSVMQNNKNVCASPTDATDKPTTDKSAQPEMLPSLTPTPDSSMPTHAPTSTVSSTPIPVIYTEISPVLPFEIADPVPVIVQPIVVLRPIELAAVESTGHTVTAVSPQPTEAVTPQPTEAVTPQPTEAVTPQPTEAVTPQPTEAVTLQPTEAVTPQPTEAVTPQPTEAVTPQPTEAVTPQPTEAVTLQPTEAVTPQPTEAVTTQPTKGVPSEPVTTTKTPLPAADGCVLEINNGEATVTRNFGTTSVIEYTCYRGYHFSLNVNKQIRICINGNMPSKPPPCEAIACPPFEPIANGRIEVTGLTYSSVARFICDPGYYITGSTIRSCDTDGEWNGIAGICKRKCTVPQSIRCNDGARVYPTKTAFADIGDVVQYSVPNGYTLIGSNPVCQPDSTWSPSPDCMKLCDERQNVPDAIVTVDRDVKSYTRKITCNEGYKPDGSDVQTCHRGTWTPLFRSCKRGCSDFALANGSTTMMLDNQFALMECDKGFHLDPPLVLVSCTEGMWLPVIPTCVPDQ